jgi:hypothetical protein
VTDDELAKILVETAAIERDTTAGVNAMFALAERMQKEREEFAGAPRLMKGAGMHSFSSDFVAQRMLRLVRAGKSAAQAIAWLRKAHTATSPKRHVFECLFERWQFRRGPQILR